MSEEQKQLILIVDRNLSTLTTLDTLLSGEGYRVTTCSSGAGALEAVARKRFDLVIAGTGGPALVSQFKALSPETNVLLLIEPNDDSMVADAIVSGADGLLRRSYSESQVIQRVERLLNAVQT